MSKRTTKNKTEEGFELNIKQTDDEREEYEEIKDLVIEVTTDENGEFEITTDKINGELCSIIINPEYNPIYNLDIYLDKYREICLFTNDDKVISSPLFLPLRCEAISNKFEKFNFSQEKYYLNDSLYISIISKPNSKMSLIFRYE